MTNLRRPVTEIHDCAPALNERKRMTDLWLWLSQAPHPAVPRVVCPRCGDLMRLAQTSTETDKPDLMDFDCECGFEYQLREGKR